jgi:hypothetical protein
MLLQTTTKLATNNLSTVISSIMLRCQRLEVQKLGRYGHTPIFQCHQTYTEEACCQSFDVGSGMPSVSARFFTSLSSTKTRYSARGCWLLDIVEVQEHWDYIWYPVASSWLWDIINREGKSSWLLFFITRPLQRQYINKNATHQNATHQQDLPSCWLCGNLSLSCKLCVFVRKMSSLLAINPYELGEIIYALTRVGRH